jgi:hypothetical protein
VPVLDAVRVVSGTTRQQAASSRRDAQPKAPAVNSISDDRDPQPTPPMAEAAAYAALSRIVLGGRPLDQALQEVAVLAGRALPEAPEVSVTLLRAGRARTAAASGPVAVHLDEQQYDDGNGPCLDAAASGGTVRVTMDDRDGPYPAFREQAQQDGVSHSMSVGIPAAGRITGALNLYSSVGPFAAESARIAGTFAGVAGLALATVDRHGDAAAVAVQLQQALASRAVINQAQGVLMARLHCSREQAFTQLVQLCEEQGVRLQQIAQVVVDETR